MQGKISDPKKKHTIDDFRGPQQEDPDDDWTQDEILAAAKKIIEEMGIDGEITDPNEQKL